VKFIFSTLWSKISPANQFQIESAISDFHVIKYNGNPFTSNHFNQFHDESMGFLKSELNHENANKTIVVTHHVPTFMNYPEKYKGDIMNEAFAVELFDLIKDSSVNCWIYGHTHYNNKDFKIGHTQLLTNQLGYVKYGEHELFNHKACINI
jgi:Icc-related predicted phosphoesterase